MGFSDSFVNAMGSGLAGTAVGAANGLLGSLLGGIGLKRKIRLQEESQKRLNEQAAKLNYEYGEQSAENAFSRQKEMYDRTFQDQTASAQRKRLEDAGLSVGLMYGGAGGAGGSGQLSSAPQGATGGAQAGQAANAASMQEAALAQTELGLQMASLFKDIKLKNKDLEVKDAQIQEIEANAEKARAEASLRSEEKITESQKRDVVIEQIRQAGLAQWMENVAKEWEREHGPNEGLTVSSYKNSVYGVTSIASGTYFTENQAQGLAEIGSRIDLNEAEADAADAMANLNNKKALGYWQEIMIEAVKGNAKMVEAKAKELVARFDVGEEITWKSIVGAAEGIAGAIAETITAIAKIKGANKGMPLRTGEITETYGSDGSLRSVRHRRSIYKK